MDVEKVSGTKSPKPSEKKDRSSTPDSEEFRQMMRTGKVSETEFEKPKKRPYQKKAGLGEELPSPPTEKSPTLPSPFESYPKAITEEPSQQPEAPQQPQKAKQTDDEKKKKKDDETVPLYQKPTLKEAPKTKGVAPKAPTPKIAPPTEEKPKTGMTPEIKPSKDKDEQEQPKAETEQLPSVLQEFPPNIAAQTQAITAPLVSYLNPEIVPLFQKMVGAIIQIQAKGITTTELILNSPAFQTSIFYGSSITLEKYSTAPAFNIFLKGPTQAVNMFNENIPNLMEQFKAAKLNIGRLEAEHEKFTFRRKEKPGKKDSGS